MTRRFATALLATLLAGTPALAQPAPPPPGQDGGHPGAGRAPDHGGRRDNGGPDRGSGRWGPNAPGGQGGYAGRGADGPGDHGPGPRGPDGSHGPDRDGPGGGQGGDGRGPDRGYGDRHGFDGRGSDRGPGGWHSPDGRGPDRGGPGAWRGPEGRGPGFDRPGPDGGRGWRGGQRPGFASGWRDDRRYDWRGWRDDHRRLFRGRPYLAPRGWSYGYRAFAPGYRLQPFFYDRAYWIDDPWAYRLPSANGSYRWIRYYNDVLLVDLRSGVIVDAVRGFFL